MPGPAACCSSRNSRSAPDIAQVRRIADANGERGDVRLAFLYDVEMRVEGRGLEYLGERQSHLVGKRGEVAGGDLMVSVLDQMQVLDQEIAAARPVAEQNGDLRAGLWIDLAPLRGRFGSPASFAGMIEGANFLYVFTQWERSVGSMPLDCSSCRADAKGNDRPPFFNCCRAARACFRHPQIRSECVRRYRPRGWGLTKVSPSSRSGIRWRVRRVRRSRPCRRSPGSGSEYRSPPADRCTELPAQSPAASPFRAFRVFSAGSGHFRPVKSSWVLVMRAFMANAGRIVNGSRPPIQKRLA